MENSKFYDFIFTLTKSYEAQGGLNLTKEHNCVSKALFLGEK